MLMTRNALYAVIAALALLAGYFAYEAYQRERDTMEIEIGPGGIRIDPPAR